MCSRNMFVVIAAATLAAASLPATSKDASLDGASPEQSKRRFLQAHPDERAKPRLQSPPAVHRPDHEPRDAHRPPRRDHAHPRTPRDDPPTHAEHRHGDHRHGDRRHWVHPVPDHRHFGYVLPRPHYHAVPRVYYAPAPLHFGAAPFFYYPHPTPSTVLQPGDYLPPQYRIHQLVVTDWEWRGLSEPAHGYQWIFLGPDNFALVAMSTGQIVSLVATR